MAELDRRYAASSALVREGVQIIAVHDSLASRFDAATRSLFRLVQRDGPGVWDDLAGPAKLLRWHLITDPLPIERNDILRSGVERVKRQAARLAGAVGEPEVLTEIRDAASALLTRDPLIGRVVVESANEVGVGTAVIVAASSRAREALGGWLATDGLRVLTLGDLERVEVSEEIAYFVGPPRFFKPIAVTAPRTPEVTFVVPGWFGDLSLPRSPISDYAEGGIRVGVRVVEAGESAQEVPEETQDGLNGIPEEELLPQPFWGIRVSEDRAPTLDEVEAHKVLLSGGRAIWLETDGERIRSLDPTQPAGERVTYVDVSLLSAGTYLLLREGAGESESLHERAFDRLGTRAASIRDSQATWKAALSDRLKTNGIRDSEVALRTLDVRAAGQVSAWISPHVIRPQRDRDFELVLTWLGLQVQPYFENASTLRYEVHRATRELRNRLEAVADNADLHELERMGHMTLDITEPGFRGIFVTKVLGISPFTELVARHEARVPFSDRGAQWLE
ncbi:hypothetical protein [Leifsonia sp. Leaf336]|uniref:hypothetical protein n=1 Tax=Leifsonia sp. Leaf336 TaxID=1736341 RepID=UPI0012F79B7C|nr:hypothetical protein [Leifsonia sp. Leaf336]